MVKLNGNLKKSGKSDTEEQILKAARRLFENKGFNGARMQEIADEAGINKSLLHYYFRSKEGLFDQIFLEAFKDFWPSIEEIAQNEDAGVRDLIRTAVNGYIDILTRMPFLSSFIVGEINRDPERVRGLMEAAGLDTVRVMKIVKRSIQNGEMIEMDPRELIVNVVGLSVFPFLSRPLLQRMFWESEQAYEAFLESRRKSVVDFICRSILVEDRSGCSPES
ncbi:MAG: TetR/AcrR family transcriptional regulator [Marinilabilia sp.]